MKCLVCGKEYEAAECPRCHFPDIQIVGDRDAFLATLMPTVQTFRAGFLGKVQVELIAYRWKDQNGQVVLDREDRMSLGTADILMQGEKWLPEQFARIPDKKEIPVRICISVSDEHREVQIAVPNLQQPELQQFGAKVDQDCNLILMLRNDSHAPTYSQPVPLLP